MDVVGFLSYLPELLPIPVLFLIYFFRERKKTKSSSPPLVAVALDA